MGAVRRLLLAALLSLALPSAAEAKPFTVGTGQNAGIAVDEGGTIYAGWQVDVYGPGDAVQFCIVPPKATACASQTTIPFPGQGYNASRVSVLMPAPNIVDVIEPRTNTGGDAASYLARSTDGGHTFAPAVRISAKQFSEGVLGPNGSIALADGPTTLRAGLFSPSGSSSKAAGSELGPYLEGVFFDIASNGSEVLTAGSDAGVSHAFRLPAGGDPNNPAAWQQIDPAPGGRQPAIAGLPGGFAGMFESTASFGNLYVQRLEGAGWAPKVPLSPAVDNVDFRLLGNPKGRLTALITYSAYHLLYATSTDGGVLWSSVVDTANYGSTYPNALEAATNSRGAGAAITDNFLDDHAVRIARFTPKTAPVARRRMNKARVQARSLCDGEKLSVLVEAAKGTRQVKPGSVLKRARFGRAKGASRGFRTRFRARYTLHRRHARIPVRVTPRHGKARTLRLRVRGCHRAT
jgi:hypothetical protein